MTNAQKMKRIYMILRWYDSFVVSIAARKDEVPDEDLKLALQFEKEMHALQAAVPKKRKKKQHVR